MQAKDLVAMFLSEFEKDVPIFSDMAGRILAAATPEDLDLALQTYAMAIQRICDGAAALGLNGVYLFMQTVCTSVYDAKQMGLDEQAMLEDLYRFWPALVHDYLIAAAQDFSMASEPGLSMLAALSPPNLLSEPEPEHLATMAQALDEVISIDESVAALMSDVDGEREDVFVIDPAAFEWDWASLDAAALAGLLGECRDNLAIVSSSIDELSATASRANASDDRPDELARLIAEAKRAAHTIKGSAQMGGLSRLSLLLHKIEDFFDHAQTPRFEWKLFADPALIEWMAKTLDEGHKIVEALLEGEPEPEPDVCRTRLENFLTALSFIFANEPAPAGLAEHESFGRDTAPAVLNDASGLAKTASTEVSSDILASLFEGLGNSRIRINHIKTQNANMAQILKSSRRENEDLQRKLEALGQFVANHLMTQGDSLDSLEKRNYSEVYSLSVSIGETNNNMRLLLDQVDKSSDFLRKEIDSVEKSEKNMAQQVLDAQMIPFGTLSTRLKRVASSTAELCSKRVELAMDGTSTLMEKGVLDALRDPLMHVIRNAIDHGFASRDGGRLSISASSFGAKVRIQVEDDGDGIDIPAVKARAVKNGLVSPERAAALSETEARALIFASGLSTRDQVSQISGRGVGLDIVKRRVEGLGGTIEARPSKSAGTLFDITVPSNLSSVNCLVARHEGGYFAIPTSFIASVVEPGGFSRAVFADGAAIEPPEGSPWTHMRVGQAGSARSEIHQGMDFSDFAKLSGRGRAKNRHQATKPKALRLRYGETILMVSIDQTLFIEDLIVKKLGPVGRARSYSLGTTVLLNGDIVPILNIPELMAAKDGARRRALGAEELAGSEAPRILVVDDSLFIRNFLEKELGDAGFETTMAIHGLDAVSKLKQQRIDLVLTDLEMPEMDGLDLAKFIKASPLHQHIPVFLVTTRSTPAYRAQAEQAGVDEFIAKPFETDNLEKKIASALARGKKSTSQGASQ